MTPGVDSARVALIASRWHAEIVDRSVDSFADRLSERGKFQLDCLYVPGAYEIPLQAQRLARSGRYVAIGACALVVDGGIYRHDFVAGAVVEGLMRVQLSADIPILSAVLTPHHFHEHDVHTGFFAAHMETKGTELADAMCAVIRADVDSEGAHDV